MLDTVPHIEVGRGSSSAADPFDAGAAAAAAALCSIARHNLSAVIVYTSSRYDAAQILRGVRSVVGNALVFGTTTAGEVCDRRATGSVAVAAIASPHLVVHCAVGSNVSQDCRRALAAAVADPQVQPFFDTSLAVRQRLTREGKTIFAMLFTPGNTRQHDSRSYELLELLKAKSLGHFPVVGGSAADDWRLETNAVLLGAGVYPDSILIAIVETKLQVGIALAHGFRSTGVETTVTDIRGQELLTLDGRAAADALPELIGSTREQLVGKHVSLDHRPHDRHCRRDRTVRHYRVHLHDRARRDPHGATGPSGDRPQHYGA